jgi:hypothetical protein
MKTIIKLIISFVVLASLSPAAFAKAGHRPRKPGQGSSNPTDTWPEHQKKLSDKRSAVSKADAGCQRARSAWGSLMGSGGHKEPAKRNRLQSEMHQECGEVNGALIGLRNALNDAAEWLEDHNQDSSGVKKERQQVESRMGPGQNPHKR